MRRNGSPIVAPLLGSLFFSNHIKEATGNRFKRIQYNYDLISGKVNMVTYQPSYFDVTQNAWVTPADQYYHRYVYDTKNRIKDVYTGRDSVMLYLFPEREAHYYYYTHGPLARTELGQLKVQGLDYAYTIQGWLKGVNPTQGGSLTNGTDTTQPFPVAQNAYGFSLHYYNGDYKAIGYTPQSSSVLGALGASAAPLYNGNIAAMAVNIPQLGSAKVYNYHYDQLNRIVAMDAYNGLNASAGTFTPVSISDYQERTAYDPSGNILTYQRNGDAARLAMDNLSYYYKPRTNQLQKVTDAAADATTNYSLYNDIKQGQLDNNYQYDGIGNLTSDASEGISNIAWTVYGKIGSITKSGNGISYAYDAAGNRIIKSTASDTTVYVRDGTGNVMSVYVKKAGGSLAQTEMHIYGSSRLGMATQHMVGDTSLVLAGGFGTAIKSTFTRGEKFFELSNHLGNVLATITDRRMQNSYMGANVDYYTADIAAANDYYPFGMQMPARSYISGSSGYRYGFNGKELDKEPVQYDYGFRIYDPRIVRFKSVDPVTKEYAELTPYQYASNSPISGIDEDGLEWAYYDKDNKQVNINSSTTNADKLRITGVKWVGYDNDAKGNRIPKVGSVATAYTLGLRGMTTFGVDAKGNATRKWESYGSLSTGNAATDNKLGTLHNSVQSDMKSFILMAKYRFGIDLRVTDGFRSVAQQDNLFSQGRTEAQIEAKRKKLGITRTIEANPDANVVTKAIGGYSNHNFGLAIDVVPFENGKLNWNTKYYPVIGLIGESRGLEWGHRWKSIDDMPHFQNLQGKTLKELRAFPKDNNGLPIIQ